LHRDAGKDEIRGGAGNDIIFGDDGNDRLLGDAAAFAKTPTGADLIYAGAGSDYVAGGSGNDLINIGSNDITHLGQDIADGNDGDDVIVGGLIAWTNDYFGGNGNDLLYPSPLRLSPLRNAVVVGKGNDIAILANGLQDGFTADEGLTAKVPVTPGCTLTVVAPGQGKAHSLSCTFGNSVGELSIGVDANGKTTVGGSFFDGMVKAKLGDLAGHPTVGGDVCICDPPTAPRVPYDFQS
jgi:Ca2+-binding RTX toxin-like protein